MRLLALALLALSLASTVCAADSKSLGTVPVSLSIYNTGATEFGFKDGVVPTLYQKSDPPNVATSLQLSFKEVRVKTTNSPSVFRFEFEKPVVINIADAQSGELVAKRPLRFLDVDVGERAEDLHNLLEVPRAFTVFMIHEQFESKHAAFLERLQKEGPEPFVNDIDLIPELFALTELSLSISLGELQKSVGRAIPAKWMSASYRKVETPTGGLSRATTTIGGSIKTFGSASFNDEWVQSLLAATHSIWTTRKDRFAQALIDAGVFRDPRPDAKILPFPAKSRAIDCVFDEE